MFSYRTCSSINTMTMMNPIKNHYANKPLQIEFGTVWMQESDMISHPMTMRPFLLSKFSELVSNVALLSIRYKIISDSCVCTILYSFCMGFNCVSMLYRIHHRHRVDGRATWYENISDSCVCTILYSFCMGFNCVLLYWIHHRHRVDGRAAWYENISDSFEYDIVV